MRRRKQKGRLDRLARIILILFYVVPLYMLIATSLKGSNVAIYKAPAAMVFHPTLRAYEAIFSGGSLWFSIESSFLIAVGTTFLTLTLATPAAYALARGRQRLALSAGLGILIILQMVPQTAAIIPLYRIQGRWNLLDTRVGVILADSALFLPFTILILRPFMRAVPIDIEEAARIDGAGRFAIFRLIVLPLVKNGLATAATLVFILAWGEFIYAISILTTPTKYPISAVISQQISAYGVGWANLMALAVLCSLPILIVYAFGQRSLATGLTLGAVK